MEYFSVNNEQHLEHHGILGMKWGVRRYQNPDGSLTEAGRRKYGYNLDVNDTSRRNVAKIRVGEARRRLDYAKLHDSSDVRKAELQGRLRTAKRVKRTAGLYDKGAKLAAKGQTIGGNNLKSLAATGAAYAATMGMAKFLVKRESELRRERRWTAGHQYVSEIILSGVLGASIIGATLVSAHQKNNNRALRTFNNQNRMGMGSIKRVGSDEYESRKKKVKAQGDS